MFHRLLIATDLSDGLHRLVQFVPDLAAAGVQQIVFFHCVPLRDDRSVPKPNPEVLQASRQQLESRLPQNTAGVKVFFEVMAGRPAEMLVVTAKKYQCDLLILGMASHSLLSEKIFGSTTSDVAQQSAIPVLILRPQLVSAYTCEEMALRCQHLFRYLLIPYDHSESARHLIEVVKQKVKEDGRNTLERCLLSWVREKQTRRVSPEIEDPESLKILDSVRGDLESLGLQVEVELRHGNPISEVQKLALEYDISAIAVSSRHFGKLWELSIPCFAGEVMRRSWHPVLFVPPR
ncbi:universal stress protein [Synechococcales cyanobacterium C]|uniref:Universal stress protein n=1 Tax=Petrachloros mirabilis ULC683 TaxID=2781853 RepID=A0A8K2A2P9_9CYAN|nr:universal stress protein [Petrachloros mirabilis]NCJ08512.1 universal stress protein [Petrachloros mirabilis ULC683]